METLNVNVNVNISDIWGYFKVVGKGGNAFSSKKYTFAGLPKRFHRLLPTAVPDINLNGCSTSNNTNMPDKNLSNDCATLFDINESDSKLFGFQTGNNKINEVRG